ncbi:MAG: DUF1295 domain-containing protein [Spirochaetota bacterium]
MKKLVLLVVIYPLAALLSLRTAAVLVGLPTISSFFFGAHPVLVVVTLAAGFAVTSYLVSTFTRDYSWVDRLWSTAPVVFAWVYAVRAELAAAPLIAAILVTVWGTRLTYNFARRGGYTTMEDYRWPILRERIGNEFLWQLFSLAFISIYQISLFVLFTLPVYRLTTLSGALSPMTAVLFTVFFLAFLAFETIADQQQYVFQNLKHGEVRRDSAPSWFGSSPEEASAALWADIDRGFLTHGLFRYSRHPNYFGELAVWWTLYLLAATATASLLDWSGIGVVLLTLLFFGSTAFTESISASRYPAYSEYQNRTSAIVPWMPGEPVPQQNEA